MNKLFTVIIISPFLISCSTIKDITLIIPESLSKWPIMHQQFIQQGNLLTTNILENIQPGTSKNTVQSYLGYPSFIDGFYQECWNYTFWLKKPNKKLINKTLSIYFKHNVVDYVQVNYEVDKLITRSYQGIVISIPDYKEKDSTINTFK